MPRGGVTSGAGKRSTAGRNLAANPSFEIGRKNSPLPERWNGPTQVYSMDRSVHRSGRASLKFANSDAKRYALCSQQVTLRPGRKYRFSVLVRTRDISGPESGATICLEWQDAQSKWLGGSYPSGVKGTHDWTRVEGVARVPTNVSTSNNSVPMGVRGASGRSSDPVPRGCRPREVSLHGGSGSRTRAHVKPADRKGVPDLCSPPVADILGGTVRLFEQSETSATVDLHTTKERSCTGNDFC